MSKLDIMIQRNNVARLVRQANRSGSHRHCIRVGKNEGNLHQWAKIRVAYGLLMRGHEILCEAIFEGGGRADVLDLDTGTAYEIVSTEKDDSLIRKVKKYPSGIKIIRVDALTLSETLIRR